MAEFIGFVATMAAWFLCGYVTGRQAQRDEDWDHKHQFDSARSSVYYVEAKMVADGTIEAIQSRLPNTTLPAGRREG